LVVVDVTGVERPVKGAVTFGVPVKGLTFGVEDCANAASYTAEEIAAADTSIAKARMAASRPLRNVPRSIIAQDLRIVRSGSR
jgi:hypothetical protein